MSKKVFDCSTPLTGAVIAAFRSDGYEAVARYLVPSSWKAITKSEADTISEAGLQIISVFETTANRALVGRAAGLVDGASAIQVANDIGQPKGSTIYFAVDFDATAAQMPAVIEYIRGASEATPGYNTGVYGSAAVIKAIQESGTCSRYWQTYAWSYGEKVEGIHIYQYKDDITIHGINVDLDESYGEEGGWDTVPKLSVEDANKVIGLLQEAYRQGVTKITLPDQTVVTVDLDEIHRLAEVQRAVSGQTG